VGLAVWGVIDGLGWKREAWARAGENRTKWLTWQTLGAPFGVGAVAAVTYFIRVRPRLAAAAVETAENTESVMVQETSAAI
jgi:hypothetical protein